MLVLTFFSLPFPPALILSLYLIEQYILICTSYFPFIESAPGQEKKSEKVIIQEEKKIAIK